MTTPPHFLTLPGEIRNQIYSYLFLLPAPSTHRTLGDPPLHPAILSTCSKIHNEGNQILYGSNTYLAHPSLLTGLPRLRVYYSTISAAPLISLIRRYHVRVRLDNDPNFSREDAANAFTGMEEVTVEVFQAQFGSSNYQVLKLFEDIRGVERARVYGSVTAFPEYVEWLQDTMKAKVGEERQFEETKEGGDDTTVRPYDIWTHGGR